MGTYIVVIASLNSYVQSNLFSEEIRLFCSIVIYYDLT